MKKNKKLLSIIILAILMLLMLLAGYTFARYYKKVDAGTSTASIARWSFGAGNTEKTIDLGNNGKIAPGSSGSFVIEVDATNSEVPIEYEVDFSNEKNIPRNMKFSAYTEDELQNGIKNTVEFNSLEELEDNLAGLIPVVEGNQKRKVTVYWNWDFNELDETNIDNEDGTLIVDENGIAVLDEDNDTSLDCKFNIEIIGKQVLEEINPS